MCKEKGMHVSIFVTVAMVTKNIHLCHVLCDDPLIVSYDKNWHHTLIMLVMKFFRNIVFQRYAWRCGISLSFWYVLFNIPSLGRIWKKGSNTWSALLGFRIREYQVGGTYSSRTITRELFTAAMPWSLVMIKFTFKTKMIISTLKSLYLSF